MEIVRKWFRLDNAAKLFPAVTTNYNSSTFRVSATLMKLVKPEVLQLALDSVIDRFPAYKVKIKRGLFWYFLETSEEKLLVEEEMECPCYSFDKNSFLVKILYYGRRISIEFFHSITDGTGAMEMLKLLLYKYILLTGESIEPEGCILNPEDIPSKYELEDSFSKYYKHVDKGKERDEKAYQIEGSLFNNFGNNIIEGIIDSEHLKEIAKTHGVTITEYLVALLIYSIYSTRLKFGIYDKPIKIVIPVNLRKLLPSETLRNFFTIINVGFKLKPDYGFKDILDKISAEIKDKLDIRKLSEQLASNYESEKNILSRFTPLFLKNLIIRIVFNSKNSQQTACLSNIGRVVIPESMKRYVERMNIVLYSTRRKPLNCGVCSVNNKLSVTFSRTIMESDIIKFFFTYMSKEEGLDVEIYSNEWGTNDKM